MSEPLAVLLDGREIGTITRNASGHGAAAFVYSNEHLDSSTHPVPLSLSLRVEHVAARADACRNHLA